jgi:ribonuclease D
MTKPEIILFKNDLPDNFVIEGDIAIDTEAMGLSYKRDRLCAVQIADIKDNAYIIQIERGQKSASNLKKLLENKEVVKIFHYARFDVAMLYQYLNIKVENIFCTKIASKLARTYTDSHGLKELCRELLSIQLSKQQQSSDWGAETLTKEQQIYSANDVIYLHKIKDKLSEMLIREDRLELAKNCFSFIHNRVQLDLAGWESIDIFSHH